MRKPILRAGKFLSVLFVLSSPLFMVSCVEEIESIVPEKPETEEPDPLESWHAVPDFFYGGSVALDIDGDGVEDFSFRSSQVHKSGAQRVSNYITMLDSNWSLMYYEASDSVCYGYDSAYAYYTYDFCDSLSTVDSVIHRKHNLALVIDSTELDSYDYQNATFFNELIYLSHFEEDDYPRYYFAKHVPYKADKMFGYLIFQSQSGKLKAIQFTHTFYEFGYLEAGPHFLLGKEVLDLN